jgi:hypothetical protein
MVAQFVPVVGALAGRAGSTLAADRAGCGPFGTIQTPRCESPNIRTEAMRAPRALRQAGSEVSVSVEARRDHREVPMAPVRSGTNAANARTMPAAVGAPVSDSPGAGGSVRVLLQAGRCGGCEPPKRPVARCAPRSAGVEKSGAEMRTVVRAPLADREP